MQSLSKMLLPVDFSERAASAARCAKMLAGHFQAELILLHVLPPLQYQFGPVEFGGVMLSDLYENRAALVNKDLNDFLAGELQGVKVTRIAVEGDPSEQIVAFAQKQSVDLVIMPTHGNGPFRRFILGSNTAKVLHDADCPVWTGVHMETARSTPDRLSRILCAVDLGPQSEKTLAWAGWLGREFDAHLTLLHAPSSIPDWSDSSQASWRRVMREGAEEELARLQQATGCDAEVLIEPGETAHVICAVAERSRADVLIIGRGSAAGVYGRLRTNAYAIIRQAPCPVVSV